MASLIRIVASIGGCIPRLTASRTQARVAILHVLAQAMTMQLHGALSLRARLAKEDRLHAYRARDNILLLLSVLLLLLLLLCLLTVHLLDVSTQL